MRSNMVLVIDNLYRRFQSLLENEE